MDQVLITVARTGVLNEQTLEEHLLLLRRIYEGVSVDMAEPYDHPNCVDEAHDPEAYIPTRDYTASGLCDRVSAPDDYYFFTPVLPWRVFR